ncbi:MAG: hypothetical protein Q8P21_00605 [bacterium]|nr:hypothetical protein [bacterium]
MPTMLKGLGLDLGLTRALLVKYYFTNPIHIPEGIKRITKTGDAAFAASHFEGRENQISEERVSGFRVANNVPNTSSEHLFSGLHAAGLILLNVYYWERRRPGREPQYVLNLTWGPPQEGVEDMSIPTEAFTQGVVWYSHIWQNPTGVNTIEFAGRQPGGTVKHVVLVEDKYVRVCPVPAA